MMTLRINYKKREKDFLRLLTQKTVRETAGNSFKEISELLKSTILLILLVFSTNVLNSQTITITKSIATGNDDVEEEGPEGVFGGQGYMYFISSDIELVADFEPTSCGTQKIGLRFTGLTVPKNATIINAYLTFNAIPADSPNTNTGTTNLTIKAQATDNATAFTSTYYNLSSRSTTTASTAWSPGSWTSGVNYNSPSITSIIQEIVNRSGWASGNAMVFSITGTGSRSANSYNGNSTLAPKLTIVYSTSPPINLSTSVTNILCNGNSTGAINLSVSGGTGSFTYDWSNDGPETPDNDPQNLSGMAAGSYVVTVTDAAGTTATATATITQPTTQLTYVAMATNVSSPGGSNGAIDMEIKGGTPSYSYLWNGGATTQNRTNLTAGNYTVTITDANGCTAVSMSTVGTNSNTSIANKQLYLSEGQLLDRINPGATPLDNSTSVTSPLSTAPSGIVVDAVTSGTGLTSPVTVSHTTSSNSNRLMLVGISQKNKVVTSVTYGGVAMTLVGENISNGNAKVHIYKMVNPPTGTANVVVNFDAAPDKGAVVGVITYSGVDQTSPLGTFNSASNTSSSPSITVSSTTGDLVFDVMTMRSKTLDGLGSGQTQRWNLTTSGEIKGGGGSTKAGASSVTMSWTPSGSADWAQAGVSIKPAASVTNVTFTESPVLCSALTVKANTTITVQAYINTISGTMPSNPNITALIKYGATTILSLTNPTYNSGTGMITWTGTRGSDMTVPAGQAIALQITTAQSGVTFQVRHDSQTYPSKITLPVSTFINVSSVQIYDASYPYGSLITDVPNTGASYIRVNVTDPFGPSDITSVNLTLTKPNNSTVNVTLNESNVIATSGCTKTYQYTWLNPGDLGGWSVQATANEGSEGVYHSATTTPTVIVPTGVVVQTKQLYLSDPSQALDRIDPLNTGDGTTASTATLNFETTKTVIDNFNTDGSYSGSNGTQAWSTNWIEEIESDGAGSGDLLVQNNELSLKTNTVGEAVYRQANLSGATAATLSLNLTSNTISAGRTDKILLEISNNGGTSYTTLDTYVAGSLGVKNYNILSFASTNTRIRLRAFERDQNRIITFDDISITFNIPGNSSIQFTESPVLCSNLTIKASQQISVITHVNIISGTMPSTPNITALLKYGSTTIISLTSPSYSGGMLTWTGSVGSNFTIPAGQAITLVITTSQSDVSFKIDYDSQTKRSRIELPVITYIDITSLNMYSAAYPGGSIITKANGGATVYLRATVTDPFGTSDITGLNVNIAPLGINMSATSVATSGCARTYQYTWSTPPSAGDYNITATAKEGYENTVVDIDYINFSSCPIVVTPTIGTSPTCNVPDGGIIQLGITGGAGPYTWNWSRVSPSGTGSGPGEQITSLTGGTYNITVTTAGGCTGTTSISLTPAQGPEVEAFPTNTGSLCYDGSIDLDVSGGSGNYTYFWSDGYYTQDRMDLVPGMYMVTVTDVDNGCTSETSAEILLGSPIDAAVFYLNPGCAGVNSGSINLTPQGGTGIYTFLWADGPTTEDRAGLAAGTYNVTISDSGGCSSVFLYTLTGASPLIIDTTSTNITCISSGAINITASGGNAPYNYDWADIPGLSDIEDRTGLLPGTYTVTVSDANGCVTSSSITLSAPVCDNNANAVCTSNISDVFSVSADPFVTSYVWTIPSGASIISGQGTATIRVNWAGAPPGYGQVCVKALNSCGTSDTLCTPVYVKTVTSAAVVAPPVCIGGDIRLIGSGGVSYTWSGPASFSSNLENPVISSASALNSGIYTVTVTNQNSCTASASVNVTVNPKPSASAVITNASACGLENGSIDLTVTGGTSPYTYVWSNEYQIQDIFQLTSGSYLVTVTDANGCSVTSSSTVNNAAGLSVTASKVDVSCYSGSNGSATSNVSAGSGSYSFQWSNGATTQNVSGLMRGTYTITVTDINEGCQGMATVIISQPTTITSDKAITNINCFGLSTGAITVTVSGGVQPYTFNWSDVAGTNNSKDRTNIASGTYNLTITDQNSCTSTVSAMITQPVSALTLNATQSNVSCNGSTNGYIYATVSGGTSPYQYVWSSGQTLKDITGLASGNYTVTVTDSKGCTSSLTRTITSSAALGITHTKTNVSCAGGVNGAIDATISGGTSPFTYIWSNGATSQDLTGINAGTYSITVSDVAGCSATTSIAVTEPSVLTAAVTPSSAGCFGTSTGSINLTVSGGTTAYTYLWSDGATTQNRTNIPSGNYVVTVSDNNLCTKLVITAIGQPNSMTTQGTATNVLCNGSSNGTIDFNAFGGTSPYTYVWSDAGTAKDRTGLVVGIYTVTVTDMNACTKTASFSINQPAVLSVNAIPVNTTCYGLSTGSISTNVSGGNGGNRYAWSNGLASTGISGLSTGLYTITVTDVKGCTVSATTVINQPTELLNTGVALPSCPLQNNGSITLNTSGGTPSYNYVWSDSGPNTTNRTNLGSGGFIVTVTDNNGCTTVSTYILNNIDLTLTKVEPNCGRNTDGSVYVKSDGELYATVSGGTPPFSYIWSNGSTAQNQTFLAPGLYTVTVASGACQIVKSTSLSGGVCIPPVANDDLYITEMNNAVSGNIATNDYDPNTEYPLTFLPLGIVSSQYGLMAWDTSFSGAFTFTPVNGYYGTFSVPYQVCDTLDLCDVGNLTVRVEKPALGLAKTITNGPINNMDGTYTATYRILVENMCLFSFSALRVEENLSATFSGATSFAVNSISSNNFTVNTSFNGTNDKNLLQGTDSLKIGASGNIDMTVTITPGLNRGPYNNNALGKANSPQGVLYTDLSQDGILTDPDNDGDPTNNNDPTPLLFCPAATISGPASICVGSTTTMSPSSNGTWTSSNPAVATITNSGVVTAVSEGTATFTYSQTGCVSEPSNPITVIGKIATVTGSTSICPGATTTLSPATGGIWSSTNPSVAVVNNSGIVTGVANGTATFIYTELSTGCTSPPSEVVNVSTNPMVSISGSSTICVGNTTQLLPSSGGTWISNNATVASISNQGLVTALSQGVATFTFTQSSGCVSNPSAPVTINGKPAISLSGDSSICIGSTTAFNPSSGGNWTSSNPSIATISNNGVITGISAGTARFIFTQTSTGCSSDSTQYITIKPKPLVSVTGPATICAGATTTLSPTTGGIWTSSNNSIATVNTEGTVFGASPGQATFRFLANTSQCMSDATAPVTINAKPVIAYTGPSTICLGTNTTVSPTTGGTWTSSNTAVAQINSSGVITGITAGTATFTYTATSSGCISNASTPLTVLGRPSVNVSGPLSICIGTTSTLFPTSGGTWSSSNSGVASVSNSGVVTGISAGSAVFYFSETSTGCISNATLPITVNAIPATSFSGPSTICQGSYTNVLPSGNGTWTSSNPIVANITNDGTVTGVSNGVATLIYTSTTGCSSSGNLQVIVNGKPAITINGPTSVCIGGATSILPASGGSWSSSNSMVATITSGGLISGVSAGTATFTFTETTTGCSSNPSTQITVNSNPVVNITGATTICVGSATTLAPTVGGSWASLNPTIATVTNTGLVQGVSAGTATFRFTLSSTGCVSAATAPITVNDKPIAIITGNNPICIGNTTTLTPSSGGIWTSTNNSVATITNGGIVTGVGQGTVRFIFTSSSTGCISAQSATLTVQAKPVAIITGNANICIGTTTTLSPSSGGTWVSSNPSVATINASGVVTGVSVGSATFTFTDSGTGCVTNPSSPVNVGAPSSVSITGAHMLCVGSTTTLSPSSGGVWVSNQPTVAQVDAAGVVTGLKSGFATFTYSDGTGACGTINLADTIYVNNCFEPDINITMVNILVAGNVKTNDNVPPGTVYGTTPTLVSKPPGGIATIVMNSDGSYTFVADRVGDYKYYVSVCASALVQGCPYSVLTITVIDTDAPGKIPIANPDFGLTFANVNPALAGDPLTLATLANDHCIYGGGCSLDATSVGIVVSPVNGTVQILSNGNIIYTPNPGYYGRESYLYKVCITGEPTNCDTTQQIVTVLNESLNMGNTTQASDDFFTTYQATSINGNVKINDIDPEGDIQFVTPSGSNIVPNIITGGKYFINSSGDFTFTPDSSYFGPTSFVYTTCDNNPQSVCTQATVYILVLKETSVRLRVYLEGGLMNNNNAKSADNRYLMRDNLRQNPYTGQTYIPVQDPYSVATEHVNVLNMFPKLGINMGTRFQTISDPATVFGVTGQNAIVDWVFVELRSKNDSTLVVASRAGLLQRDGDIVDIDGVSPLKFPGIGADYYYFVVRHRNHLGAMTQILPSNTLIDFTSLSTPLFSFGMNQTVGLDYSGYSMNQNQLLGYRALYAGDFDADGKLKFVNPNDDQNILFFDVLLYPTNINSTSNFNQGYGYNQGDYDLNGKIKYDNPDDDKNLLFSQILLFPLNSALLSNFNYFIQQIPVGR